MSWRISLPLFAVMLACAGCTETVSELVCGAAETKCGSSCVDLQTDPRHCGACGAACAAGEVCAAGACQTVCPAGQEKCDGACFTLATAERHCGRCGHACDAQEYCVAGGCSKTCKAPFELCGTDCVDPLRDATHCGSCDGACVPGERCLNGSCETSCAAGQELCEGLCRDLQTDRAHCGACLHACGADELCSEGHCELHCPADTRKCDATCAAIQVDRANCGACGHGCGTNEVCQAGACVLSCGGAAPDACDGACTNLLNAPQHCGACGHACDGGEVCNAGSCQGSCTPPAEACSGRCTATLEDPANCGACGHACVAATNATPVCSAGACTRLCMGGYDDCNHDLQATTTDGCETQLAVDAHHCGACGRACAVANGSAKCVAGACAVDQCDAGKGDCDADAANGCETDVTKSAAHCGACGHACAAGELCSSGACVANAATCAHAAALALGSNSIAWDVSERAHLTNANVTCRGAAYVSGPEVILSHTPAATGFAQLTFSNAANTRWAAVATATCSDVSAPLTCASDTAASLNAVFPITAGTPFYVHVVGTTAGALTQPLAVNLATMSCATDAATATEMSPAVGATATSLAPKLVLSTSFKMDKTTGSFTITSTSGATATIPVTQTANVTFSNFDRTVTIDPKLTFIGSDVVTVTWTGLKDGLCGNAIAQVPWTFNIRATPCTPGRNGMVGTTMTRFPATGSLTGLPATYYAQGGATPDADPNGYVYLSAMGSGTTTAHDIFRVKKDGSAVQNARALFDATATGANKEGYAPLVFIGSSLYSVDNSNGTTGVLWRLSTDGGATWDAKDMATFATPMNYVSYAAAAFGGKVFILTRSTSTTTVAEIWSVDPSAWTATTPAPAVKETTINAPYNYGCQGLAVDAGFYYAVCGKNGSTTVFALVRISRTSGDTVELLLTDTAAGWFRGSTSSKQVYAVDRTGDGLADFIYVRNGNYREAYYVCDPAGAAPFGSKLTEWATGTSSYGAMGYDPVANVLWVFDDVAKQLVKIQ